MSSEDDMIISTHFYVALANKDELNAYVCYLTYRVQRDLYEILKESGQFDGVSWREFVWDVRHTKRIRTAAIIVAQETLKDFRNKGHFNFGVKDVKLLFDSDMDDRSGGNIYSSQLFPAEEGRAQVESILLTAEVVQYKRQLAEGKAYSWEDYLAELSQGTSLWDETLMAFRQGRSAPSRTGLQSTLKSNKRTRATVYLPFLRRTRSFLFKKKGVFQ